MKCFFIGVKLRLYNSEFNNSKELNSIGLQIIIKAECHLNA